MISDAKTFFLGVVSLADFASKWRLARELAHAVNRATPMQTFVGAVPIIVEDPLCKLFTDVGRF
jgi:hypothetical protein